MAGRSGAALISSFKNFAGSVCNYHSSDNLVHPKVLTGSVVAEYIQPFNGFGEQPRWLFKQMAVPLRGLRN